MEKLENKLIKLSPSTLHLFLECPRCFWLEKAKDIKRPRGIFPSLPSGMDRVIKIYFDGFRSARTLPTEFAHDDLKGVVLFDDQDRLDKWRSWRTGLVYQDEMSGASLSGALDDLLVKDGKYIPFDYKTKGSMTTEKDAVKYYQNQLDVYALLLESNGLPTTGYGFLLYFSPKSVQQSGTVRFELQPIKITTDIERARQVFRNAVSLLKGPLPPINQNCEYCAWLRKFKIRSDGS